LKYSRNRPNQALERTAHRCTFSMLSALFALFLSVGLLSVFAGQPDPRFEGIWKGVETYQVPARMLQVGAAPIQKSAVIAIGDSGRILAVVQGLYPGRYAVSPKWLSDLSRVSGGNTLFYATFDSPNWGYHLARGACKLVLSPDGNTLTETGGAMLPGIPGPVSCEITATFHRQGANENSSDRRRVERKK
jgi:hypothetical protein